MTVAAGRRRAAPLLLTDFGILSERAARASQMVSEQLQHALNSRIVIEQAKGVIAESLDLSVDVAFLLMRSYARSHSLGLNAVARQLIDRALPPDVLRAAGPRTAVRAATAGGEGDRPSTVPDHRSESR